MRLPGASIASAIQLRPCTGSSWTCSGLMLPPRLELATFSSGASAITVTVSWTVESAICISMCRGLPDRATECRSANTVVKPVQLRGQLVAADACGNAVDTAFVGDGDEPVPRRFVNCGDGDARQHAAARIGDCAGQYRLLRENRIGERRSRNSADTTCN